MLDREQFSGYVADALNRLHDHWYLRGHPLGELLAVGGRPLDPTALQRLLFDTVRELRPPDSGVHHAGSWRKYRHLVLRCVEALPPAEVASQLGVSERQARRDHHEAVEAVVNLLWERLAGRDPAAAGHDEPPEAGLDDDLARVGAAPTGPVQLAAVVGDAVETVAPLALSRGVRVRVDFPSDLPHVTADAGVLRHLLVILLSAGVDRAPPGQVDVGAALLDGEVELRVERRDAGARGPDEPPGALGTDHAASLGTAARLARLQGACLEWRDEPESRFAGRLRLRAFRPATVLMVDDNPDFVRLFRRYLSGEPYRIVEAKVAEEAVPLAVSVRPDLVVLDLMMPSQDGWRILRQLKLEPGTRDIPVVVCSVLRERALALSLGAVDLLPKPITQPTLLACLARHCAAGAAAPAGTASPRRPSDPPGG